MDLPLIVVSPGRPPTPVMLQTDPGTTVAEVAAALVERFDLADGRAAVELYHGATVLAGTDELAGCGLAQGSIIGLGGPPPPVPTGVDGVELAVVGGPGAGRRAAATPPAVITLGRSSDNTVSLDDPRASRHHARVDLRLDGAVVEDLGSTNGVGWAGYRLAGPQALSLGDAFLIGDSVLALRAVDPAARVLDPVAGGGTRHFNRPPRLPPPPVVTDLDVPAEPDKPTGRRFPLLSLLAPVAIGAVLVIVLHSLIYLAFIVLSPVMGLSNYLGDRRHGRREYRTKLATYHRDVAQLDANLAAAGGGRRAGPAQRSSRPRRHPPHRDRTHHPLVGATHRRRRLPQGPGRGGRCRRQRQPTRQGRPARPNGAPGACVLRRRRRRRHGPRRAATGDPRSGSGHGHRRCGPPQSSGPAHRGDCWRRRHRRLGLDGMAAPPHPAGRLVGKPPIRGRRAPAGRGAPGHAAPTHRRSPRGGSQPVTDRSACSRPGTGGARWRPPVAGARGADRCASGGS